MLGEISVVILVVTKKGPKTLSMYSLYKKNNYSKASFLLKYSHGDSSKHRFNKMTMFVSRISTVRHVVVGSNKLNHC